VHRFRRLAARVGFGTQGYAGLRDALSPLSHKALADRGGLAIYAAAWREIAAVVIGSRGDVLRISTSCGDSRSEGGAILAQTPWF